MSKKNKSNQSTNQNLPYFFSFHSNGMFHRTQLKSLIVNKNWSQIYVLKFDFFNLSNIHQNISEIQRIPDLCCYNECSMLNGIGLIVIFLSVTFHLLICRMALCCVLLCWVSWHHKYFSETVSSYFVSASLIYCKLLRSLPFPE